LSTGIIIGIVFGSILACVILIILINCFCKNNTVHEEEGHTEYIVVEESVTYDGPPPPYPPNYQPVIGGPYE
jgi:hypothetical protein